MSQIRTTDARGTLPPSRRGASVQARPAVPKEAPMAKITQAQPRFPAPPRAPLAAGPTALDRRTESAVEIVTIWSSDHLEDVEGSPVNGRRFCRLQTKYAKPGTGWAHLAGVEYEVERNPNVNREYADLERGRTYLMLEVDGRDVYVQLTNRGVGYVETLANPPARRAALPRPVDMLGRAYDTLGAESSRKGITITFAPDGGMRILATDGRADPERLTLLERARPLFEAANRGVPLRCAWPHAAGEAPLARTVTWPAVPCCDPRAHEVAPEPVKRSALARLASAVGL